jgi:hypothetical protein
VQREGLFFQGMKEFIDFVGTVVGGNNYRKE